jgi:hypothetical protein
VRETSVRETHNESQGNVEACDVAVVEVAYRLRAIRARRTVTGLP